MNFVEPIKSTETITAVARYLKADNERNYIMFLIGIHTSLRISEILQLRVRDIQGGVIISAGRDSKHVKKIPIHDDLRGPLYAYIENKEGYEYLIKSRKGFNKNLTSVSAYRIIKDIEQQFNLKGLGTHSLRKTFGYHYYQATGDIDTLQRIYGHTTSSATLRYIGIIDHDTNKAFNQVKLYQQS